MGEYLKFDRMITPIIIQIIFWVLVVIIALIGLWSMFGGSNGTERLTGLAIFIIGPILVRIYCEIMIVMFQINDKLHDIRQNTKK
jgi:hypothetical protein